MPARRTPAQSKRRAERARRRTVCGAAAAVALTAAAVSAAGGETPLVDAAAGRDWPAVRALLRAAADVNAAHGDGATALHWAAHWDDVETADLLLGAGAAVDAANDHGVTPLLLAAENRSAAMAARLLDAGADPNAALPAEGETVLMRAAHSGDARIVRMLLDRGADVGARTAKTGQTALMWAVAEGHLEAARLLLARGADPRARSNGRYTPLLFAARQGDPALAGMLTAAGAPVDRDGGGRAPLAVAIEHARVPFARLLIARGADPNVRLRNGGAPLHEALLIGGRQRGYDPEAPVREPPDKRDLIRDLLAAGADPDFRRGAPRPGARIYSPDGQASGFDRGPTDPDNFGVARRWIGASPFWVAAHKADVTLMRMLLDAGADPAAAADDGSTPLMAAAGLGHAGDRYEKFWSPAAAREAVALLVELGADVNAANEAGFTALHGAAFVGADAAAEHLIAHGADLNAQDFAGRTPYRIAEGHKGGGMSFVSRPSTAALLARRGADTTLGPHFNDTEREEGLTVR